jgi:hypothetical protein
MRGNWRSVAIGLLGVAGITFLAGCGQSGAPGGPGVTERTTNKPVVTDSKESFKLSTDTSTTIKQGDRKDMKVGISRGSSFDQDVALKFNDLPQGVTIDPASPMLKHDAKDVQLVVAAAPDAPVGDYTIHIVGRPATGPDSISDLKLSIAKK